MQAHVIIKHKTENDEDADISETTAETNLDTNLIPANAHNKSIIYEISILEHKVVSVNENAIDHSNKSSLTSSEHTSIDFVPEIAKPAMTAGHLPLLAMTSEC